MNVLEIFYPEFPIFITLFLWQISLKLVQVITNLIENEELLYKIVKNEDKQIIDPLL